VTKRSTKQLYLLLLLNRESDKVSAKELSLLFCNEKTNKGTGKATRYCYLFLEKARKRPTIVSLDIVAKCSLKDAASQINHVSIISCFCSLWLLHSTERGKVIEKAGSLSYFFSLQKVTQSQEWKVSLSLSCFYLCSLYYSVE
jgi:hypothetical protein